MVEKTVLYEPSMGAAGLRPRECPAGNMLDPASTKGREICPTSELNYQVRYGGKARLSEKEIRDCGFSIISKEGEVPFASCDRCSNEIILRRIVQE